MIAQRLVSVKLHGSRGRSLDEVSIIWHLAITCRICLKLGRQSRVTPNCIYAW